MVNYWGTSSRKLQRFTGPVFAGYSYISNYVFLIWGKSFPSFNNKLLMEDKSKILPLSLLITGFFIYFKFFFFPEWSKLSFNTTEFYLFMYIYTPPTPPCKHGKYSTSAFDFAIQLCHKTLSLTCSQLTCFASHVVAPR